MKSSSVWQAPLSALFYKKCYNNFVKNIVSICIVLLIILGLSTYFYMKAQHEGTYAGLTTVPCFDTTLPTKQQYSFTIRILVHGEQFPLNPTLGHDFGNCLHVVYENDASGTVYVKANDTNTYTLGQFFDVWHTTFNNYQMANYISKEKIRVTINGTESTAANVRDILLLPGRSIVVMYD